MVSPAMPAPTMQTSADASALSGAKVGMSILLIHSGVVRPSVVVIYMTDNPNLTGSSARETA